MGIETKVGKKYQTVIPSEIRHRKGLEGGDSLIWEIDETTNQIIVIPKPRSFTRHMRGLGKRTWKKVNVNEYIKRERDSWE